LKALAQEASVATDMFRPFSSGNAKVSTWLAIETVIKFSASRRPEQSIEQISKPNI
jgi:hypothetical protein